MKLTYSCEKERKTKGKSGEKERKLKGKGQVSGRNRNGN